MKRDFRDRYIQIHSLRCLLEYLIEERIVVFEIELINDMLGNEDLLNNKLSLLLTK